MDETKKKEIVDALLNKSILVSKGALDPLLNSGPDFPGALLEQNNFLYLNKDILNSSFINPELSWFEFERAKANSEKYGKVNSYNHFLSYLNKPQEITKIKSGVRIITSYAEQSTKQGVQDFTMYFNTRLSTLQKILLSRDELKGTTSISRILAKRDRENVSIIGMVKEKHTTKNQNIILTMEDSTGEIKVLINKNKPELFNEAKDIILDETIGVSGVNGTNIIFANNLLWPDIPTTNELKKTPEEGYALFLSDIHVGSNNFLEEDFNKFLGWLNQKTGTQKQKDVASKVKYIFIVGDLVDGVGIFPGQDEELKIKDIYEQYTKCAELLSNIPQNIEIIVCGGNHDALRISEPQPALTSDITKELCSLPNIKMVSNPALVNIHSSDIFPGYNILLYHGYSFDHYVANVDSIRNNGGYDRADLIMKFLLKRRHLAPTHTSTQYIPYNNTDPLIISPVPDFFITGHIHKSSVSHYKNVTLISGSCWQSKTPFQEKVGHHPEPSRVPIVNLSTREVKILRFGK